MKVLVLSPGHPLLFAGGAETASYALFQQLKLQKTITEVTFVARSGIIGAASGSQIRIRRFRGRADELLLDLPPLEHFTFTSQNPEYLRDCLNQVMSLIRPDIVHVHHFHQYGIEIFEIKVPFHTQYSGL